MQIAKTPVQPKTMLVSGTVQCSVGFLQQETFYSVVINHRQDNVTTLSIV